MALFLSSIDNDIQYTLNKRQEYVDINKSGWFSKKTPWVRFTSMASINGDSNLRKNWILYNGLSKNTDGNTFYSGFDGMYNLSDEIFNKSTTDKQIKNRPIPGIIDVSIQNKGSMGALREAVINFVCWDKKQLTTLEKLFMTPGVSCLLEWGWSLDIDENIIYKNLSKEVSIDSEKASEITNEVKKTKGHYDALQGPIVDFSWTLRDDGGFDCTTTLTSRADMLLAINLHGKAGNKTTIDIEDATFTLDEDMKSVFDGIIMSLEDTSKNLEDDEGNVVGQLVRVHSPFKLENEDKEAKEIRKGKRFFDLSSIRDVIFNDKKDINNYNQGYITWGYLEKLLNENLFFERDIGQDNKIFPILKTSKILSSGKDRDLINYRYPVVSCDPAVCILPTEQVSIGKNDLELLSEFTNNFHDVDTNNVHLSLFLINVRFIFQTFFESETLNEFLIKLLNTISDVCGGMWDFQIMVDEEEPETIYIVDKKTIVNEIIKPYTFKVYNRNSVVKNVSLNTEVDQKIKVMMMYGSHTKNSKDQIGTESSFGYRLFNESIYDVANGKITQTSKTPSKNEVTPILQVDTDQELVFEFKKEYGKVLRKRTHEVVEKSKAILNKIVTRPFDRTTISRNNKFPILPIKLSLTIDGISGIRFGNAIDIDYKPERYTGETYFQITNVSQTINRDTWETSIETIMRVNQSNLKRPSDWYDNATTREAESERIKAERGTYGTFTPGGYSRKSEDAGQFDMTKVDFNKKEDQILNKELNINLPDSENQKNNSLFSDETLNEGLNKDN